MAKKFDLSKSKALPCTFLILSVVAAILFRCCRTSWVFIGNTLGSQAMPVILLFLMIAFSVLLGILSVLRLNGSEFCHKKAYKTLLITGCAFSSVLFLFSFIYTIGYAPGEEAELFTIYLKRTLAEGTFLLLIPFFTIFYPKLCAKAKKTVTVLSLAAAVLFAVNAFFPLTSYKITSDPLVIDNGSEYSIVFSTNDKGTAWVEYTFEGKDYKIYDNTGGRLNGDSEIHSISVPYEHLRNNTYKVSSTRVTEEFSYGSRSGKTVISAEYDFKYNNSDNQTWLVISDWHTKLEAAYEAIGKVTDNYNAVILLGDAVPGVDFEQQVITNIVEFGGNVSGGTRPVLYVRGNHETRGAYAKDLPTALGMDKFYYTSDIGPYSFVVLDSGEDKEDSHIEYGGMNDYNTYRADMIEWLKGTKVESKKVIALSHAWQISQVEPELSAAGWAELDRLGTSLIISGHEHNCRFLGESSEYEKELKEKYPDITGYIDGGKMNDGYVASLLTLNEKGFEIKATDNAGNEIMNEKFDW